MIPYIIIFILIFTGIWFSRKNKIIFWGLQFILILFIGLRHEVGCDWQNYLYMYGYNNSLDRLFPPLSDFLYDFINFIANKLNLGIYFVNSFAATILIIGTFLYAKTKKYYPYLIIYSIPYLFFVVGMGYTRQAMAIGFLFISIYFLEKKKVVQGLFSIILAFLSHKTILILLILYLLLNFNLLEILVIFVLVVIFFNFYSDKILFYIIGLI